MTSSPLVEKDQSPRPLFTKTQKEALEIGLSQQEEKKSAEDALAESEKICSISEESLINDESAEE